MSYAAECSTRRADIRTAAECMAVLDREGARPYLATGIIHPSYATRCILYQRRSRDWVVMGVRSGVLVEVCATPCRHVAKLVFAHEWGQKNTPRK